MERTLSESLIINHLGRGDVYAIHVHGIQDYTFLICVPMLVKKYLGQGSREQSLN